MSWTPWGGVGTPTPESWGSQTFGSLGGGSGRPLDACVHGGGGGGDEECLDVLGTRGYLATWVRGGGDAGHPNTWVPGGFWGCQSGFRV